MAQMTPRQMRRQEVMANRQQARQINAQPGIAAQRQQMMMGQSVRQPVPRPGVPAPVQLPGGQMQTPTAGMDAGMAAQMPPVAGQQPGQANPYDREALDRYMQHLQRNSPGGSNYRG